MAWKQHSRLTGAASQGASLSANQQLWTRAVQFTKEFTARVLVLITPNFQLLRARIRSFISSDRGLYYEEPFAWMEEYNAALLEPDTLQAKARIQAALRAVLQRKCALEENGVGSPEWNLLQYAELVLRHIGRERILLTREGTRQQAELFQEKKAA